MSVSFEAWIGRKNSPAGLQDYTIWSDMRDTLSMLLTWVDRDFRLSVLVLVCILFVRFWPCPQQWQEKAALNSSRNFPGEKQKHEIHSESFNLNFLSHSLHQKQHFPVSSAFFISNQCLEDLTDSDRIHYKYIIFHRFFSTWCCCTFFTTYNFVLD